jgi:hypothetical protein
VKNSGVVTRMVRTRGSAGFGSAEDREATESSGRRNWCSEVPSVDVCHSKLIPPCLRKVEHRYLEKTLEIDLRQHVSEIFHMGGMRTPPRWTLVAARSWCEVLEDTRCSVHGGMPVAQPDGEFLDLIFRLHQHNHP